MSLLCYNRERVGVDLRVGALVDVAERLHPQSSGDIDRHEGLHLIDYLVDSLSEGDDNPWRLDGAKVAVVAHFSSDADGQFVYGGDLTVSVVIKDGFEISDTGISSLDELTEFTAEQDGPARALAILDALTARLNIVLSHALRFARALSAQQRRAALPPPVRSSSASSKRIPGIAEIAAQSRREISRVDPLPTAATQGGQSSMPAWVGNRPTAEQLMTARVHAMRSSRTSIRLEVLARNRAWLTAGCPTTRVTSITPGAGSEHDTEILLSNGLRLLVNATGVLLTDTRGRLLHLLDEFNPDNGQPHLDLELRP
ncbi:hypothetical protein C5E45_20635 [Nocardia nova]|uniref:Uncharacterized protein n=1 Tax=Nocardia nova TaxID=37330 RepID=A0A2S6AMK2_9NOCA|nr:hypothetical protein [Nocardia nova]PPJ36454.1 hypothetical protein C5E45_20635 [Nocardia nova]